MAAGKKQDANRWLLTYSDMITLLMVFFVILFSMAQLDLERYREVAIGLRQAFGGVSDIAFSVLEGQDGAMLDSAHSRPSQIELPLAPYDRLDVTAELGDAIVRAGIEGEVTVRTTIEGVIVSLTEQLTFAPGRAELRPEGKEALDNIAAVLHAMPNEIRVEAHTDDRPTDNPMYPTNWELSTARAVAITRYLVECGIHPSRLAAAGYAEHRPLMPNDTIEHRALNRRASLVLLYPVDEQGFQVQTFPEVKELQHPIMPVAGE